MKKRVKLLTTIASLCLAVALMAFGVYAATSATFSVSSTVTFVNDNVDVTYTITAVHNTGVTRTPGTQEDYYTEGTKTWTTGEVTQGLQVEDDLETAYNMGTYEFDQLTCVNNSSSVTYTIKVQNNSTSTDYTLAVTGAPVANTYGAIKITSDIAATATLTPGTPITYTVVYMMVDNTIDTTEAYDSYKTFNPTFIVTKATN